MPPTAWLMRFGVVKILKRSKNEKIHGEQLFYLFFCVRKYSSSSHPEALPTISTTAILPVLQLYSYKIPSEMEVAPSAPSAEGAEGAEVAEGA